MRICEFCSAPLPEAASYRGICLHVPSPGTFTNYPQQGINFNATGVQNTAMPVTGGDEYEAWKRRASLMGAGASLLGAGGQLQHTVPLVQEIGRASCRERV